MRITEVGTSSSVVVTTSICRLYRDVKSIRELSYSFTVKRSKMANVIVRPHQNYGRANDQKYPQCQVQLAPKNLSLHLTFTNSEGKTAHEKKNLFNVQRKADNFHKTVTSAIWPDLLALWGCNKFLIFHHHFITSSIQSTACS